MAENNKDMVLRIRLVYIGVLLFALIIIFKILKIQFVEGDMWRSRSENLTLRYDNVEAIRGNIISSDSTLLATSVPIFDVKIDMSEDVIPEDTFNLYLPALADSLSRAFPEKSKSEFKNYLLNGREKEKQDLLIHKNIDYHQLKRLRTFPILKKGRFKGGFIVDEKDYRFMPFKMLASRTIGYKNIDENLYVGLEGAYSKELEGISGRRLMRKVANGVWRPVENNNQIEPENGKDIITTIDINIQDVAEHALMKCLDSNNADHGCAILMEVKTGYIKAIANLKKRKDGSFGEDINYAIWESAEPGSTFKLASLLAVLDEGKYDTNEIVPTGKCMYANREMIDSHEEGYGRVSVAKAFMVSSNVGISQIVYKTFYNEPQKFIDRLYAMSINKPLGVELKGEGAPFIKDTKNPTWSKTSLPWMSIGYELQITPLQTLTLYNAVANDGVMVKPLFVKEIRQTGKLIKLNEATVINKAICTEQTLKKVKKILEEVVEHGTAKNLFNTVYKIAGKTGTAQLDYGKADNQKTFRASFVGYFPADNPKYSCIVIINNPSKGKYYGGAVAAPVFKEIADKVYATQLNIHQEEKKTVSRQIPYVAAGNQKDISTIFSKLNFPFSSENPEADWVESYKKDTITKYKTKVIKPKVVPETAGMGVKDAVYILEKCGLKVTIVGKGSVESQSIPGGSSYEKGQQIILYLRNRIVEKQTVVAAVIPDSTKATIKEVIPKKDKEDKVEKPKAKVIVAKKEIVKTMPKAKVVNKAKPINKKDKAKPAPKKKGDTKEKAKKKETDKKVKSDKKKKETSN
ncbi:MAG: penicillin-binding transpeptidase domain-containing protein [Bacteroidota bacterium]